jgi:RNA ligase (TIGR02306 family)
MNNEDSAAIREALVYEVIVNPHPDPETTKVGVVNIEGYTVVANKEAWLGQPLGVFVEPESVVDTTLPIFSFLAKDSKPDGTYRVKAKNIRGVKSFGLLVPAPEGAKVGDNLWAELQLRHYQPEPPNSQPGRNPGECGKAPGLSISKYDVANGRKLGAKLFHEGEPILVVEKVHGEHHRVVFHDGKLFVGSREQWKNEFASPPKLDFAELSAKVGEEKAKLIIEQNALKAERKARSHFWEVLDRYPGVVKFAQDHPDHVLCGEIYGKQKSFPYDTKDGKTCLVCFDIFDARKGIFLDGEMAINKMEAYGIRPAPVLYRGPYSFDNVCELAEGLTVLGEAKHIREGVVVRPAQERVHPRYGRCVLKWISADYLQKS